MIAYKGFNRKLESVLGNGKKETCTFEPGKTYTETDSKTMRSGFHCCENPFECLSYYRMDGENRFFQVEAAGDINEDGGERIACTEITLLKELTPMEIAYFGMLYMIEHPMRSRWKQEKGEVIVEADNAKATKENQIAIARGEEPIVKGVPGSILGLIVEPQPGNIEAVKLFRSTKNVWMELTEDRELREVDYEEEND